MTKYSCTDIFKQTLNVGDRILHFNTINSSIHVTKGWVVGFTHKMAVYSIYEPLSKREYWANYAKQILLLGPSGYYKGNVDKFIEDRLKRNPKGSPHRILKYDWPDEPGWTYPNQVEFFEGLK